MENEKRLDVYMAEQKLANTRSKATQLIKAGLVFVNGKVIKKAGFLVKENDNVIVQDDEYSPATYVGRGGLKLYHALKEFEIDVKDKSCLDIGSSTGGFTDCLLKKEAKKVLAIDVGKEQLHESLLSDKRVISLQSTDIRTYETDERFDFICVDVSFISVIKIFPKVKELATKDAEIVVLIKPQFEVGRDRVSKGVVKSNTSLKKGKDSVVAGAKEAGFKVVSLIDSPIEGKEGNKEFLLYLRIQE